MQLVELKAELVRRKAEYERQKADPAERAAAKQRAKVHACMRVDMTALPCPFSVSIMNMHTDGIYSARHLVHEYAR